MRVTVCNSGTPRPLCVKGIRSGSWRLVCRAWRVISGIVIDTNTANATSSTATANIYDGTREVSGMIQSTIVQLAQEF